MNKQLTLQDKQRLIKMLKAHYQIKCESFINVIAEDETEKTDLTLKAFSMAMPKIEEIKNPLDNSKCEEKNDVTIKITYLGASKLCLIKAVKESISLKLAEAKSKVDAIVGYTPGGEGFAFTPFKIGDSGCMFTKEQWHTILGYMKSEYGNDSIRWYTV